MIPKIIHYCWFGQNRLPEEAIKCINSWKKFCPKYKIIEWNEKNYNVRKNKYMSDAYDEKKWAFVSDYARIDIVYNYGGIYLDTDVELIKTLDAFLNDPLFCGWERDDDEKKNNFVAFGLGFGAEKNSIILKDILKLYDNINFINDDGTLNLIPCPSYQTMILEKYGLDTRNRDYQKNNNFVVYPESYFSPKSLMTGKIELTKDTVSIHHFSHSWGDKGRKFYDKIERKLAKKVGELKAHIIVEIISIPYKVYEKIKKYFEAYKRRKNGRRINEKNPSKDTLYMVGGAKERQTFRSMFAVLET